MRCSGRGSPSGRATDGYGVRRTVQAPRRCVGSLAVHLRGPPCPSARPAVFAGSQAFTCARQPPCGPGTSRTSPQRGRGENLHSHSASPVDFVATFPVQLSLRLLRHSDCPCGLPRCRARRPLRVFQRSPFHRDTWENLLVVTVQFACAFLSWRRSGIAMALACRPALCPTSPFDAASPVSSPPSCRNVASGPDRRVRQLSRGAGFRPHPVPAVALSALRSFPPRYPQPDPLTRTPRRPVTPPSLPKRSSPNPLPSRPWSSPTGTSRLYSCIGAVPPCLVTETDRSLLPWACPPHPPRRRVQWMAGTSKNVRKNGLSVPTPGSPVAG